MTRIACRRLLGLREQNLLVPDEQRPEALVFVRQRTEPIDVHGRSDPCQLNNSFVERNSSIEGRPGSYCAVPADRGRFYHIPDAELDDQRDDPGVRKINATDCAAGFGEDIAVIELD